MAAGIGMEAGQKEADLISGTSAQVMEALANILKALAVKKDYSFSDVDDKGLKAILEHIRKGGKVRQSIIDDRDAELFERSLRARHIPYTQLGWKDPEGAKKRVYMTRSGAADGIRRGLPDDTRLLEEAWEMFAMQIRERLEAPERQGEDIRTAEDIGVTDSIFRRKKREIDR